MQAPAGGVPVLTVIGKLQLVPPAVTVKLSVPAANGLPVPCSVTDWLPGVEKVPALVK